MLLVVTSCPAGMTVGGKTCVGDELSASQADMPPTPIPYKKLVGEKSNDALRIQPDRS